MRQKVKITKSYIPYLVGMIGVLVDDTVIVGPHKINKFDIEYVEIN